MVLLLAVVGDLDIGGQPVLAGTLQEIASVVPGGGSAVEPPVDVALAAGLQVQVL
jgi:hypothetical protein